MAITFTATGKYEKLKKFLGTECGDYFTAVAEVATGVSTAPNKLLLYTQPNSIELTPHQPDDWSEQYASYYKRDPDTNVYYHDTTMTSSTPWEENTFYEAKKSFFIEAAFANAEPTVVRFVNVLSADGTENQTIQSSNTNSKNTKLAYYAKCGGGIMICFTDSTLLTNPAAAGACIIVTKNNLGDTTAVFSKINSSSSTITRPNTFAKDIYAISDSDQFEMINTFAYTRQYGEQWQFVPFITVGDGTNASYTPHAYYAQCVEYGFDTNFSRIVDKEGYLYMTNGYWAVKDITEDDNQTDEGTE